MKKSTLALSVAAAIGSFGLVGNAFAIGTLGVGSVYSSTTQAGVPVTAPAAATRFVVNPDGIGHQLIVPYYTVQDSAQTLLNIANTDTRNAKVVKVRFRGAANSDDVFDFQLLLSPGDIWAGSLTQDATTGVSKLTAYDNSCTIPFDVRKNQTLDDKQLNVVDSTGSLFITSRVDPTPAQGSAANETREGYVEIINMADIPPNAYNLATTADAKAATLYGTVKHASGVAACSDSVLSAALKTDYADVLAANTASAAGTTNLAYSLTAPSGGLTADWVILNQTKTAAWSGSATALEARTDTNARGLGNLVFWPQLPGSNVTTPQLNTRQYTADPLFATRVVPIQHFDLPDLSTPYLLAELTPPVGVFPAHMHIDALANLLDVTSITNQYVTVAISGVTDFLFSQPTRRYAVGVNYKAASGADYVSTGTLAVPILRNNAGGDTSGNGNARSKYWYEMDALRGTPVAGSTLTMQNRQVCLTSLGNPAITDRNESIPAGSGFVTSPFVPGAALPLCGEVAIMSVNSGGVTAGSALSATVVRNDTTFATGFDVGSATFSIPGSDVNPGMPILSSTFMRVANGSTFYGFTIPSKVTR